MSANKSNSKQALESNDATIKLYRKPLHGRWKFLSTHAYNTFTAAYFGGWVQNPGTRLPGMSESFPPDSPPTVEFSMFPTVYEIPFRYPNPVTNRY